MLKKAYKEFIQNKTFYMVTPCSLFKLNKSAAGTLGRPGMVIIAPQITTKNSAVPSFKWYLLFNAYSKTVC